MKYIKIALITLVFNPFGLFAQVILEKDAAFQQVLENNFDLQIVNKQLEIANNNTSIFNTGYLPTVSSSVGATFDLGGSKVTFADGHTQKLNAASTKRTNASIGANYLIYDGKRRAYNLENLKAGRTIAELNVRQSIEFTMLQLFSTYYDIAKITQDVFAQEQTLEVSKKRMQRAQYKFDYGQGSRLSVLNAQVDVNRDSINYNNLQRLLANAKRNLNVIMQNDINNDFEVDTTVLYTSGLFLEDLLQNTKINNIQLLLAEQNIYQSDYRLKLAEANLLPTVGANLSYSWNLTDNPLSDNPSPFQSDLIRSNGLGLGVTASWNIFDGGTTRTNIQNAKITIESQQLNKAALSQEIERDVVNAWETYQNALYVLQAENKNLETNRRNFRYTDEQFQIGQVSSVEYRQAQLNLLNATRNYNQAKFNAKVFELSLLQLSGQLIGAQY
jgi:outer membrane protein TolC